MLNNKYIFLLIVCLSGGYVQAMDTTITAYGAVADGRTINTQFIQKAIDDVAASGGGRVVVPPGNFMTGTLFLKSGVDLHVSLGAALLGSHVTDD